MHRKNQQFLQDHRFQHHPGIHQGPSSIFYQIYSHPTKNDTPILTVKGKYHAIDIRLGARID